MIPKSIDNISKPDIDALIENQVREGRTIEYKQILPGNSDDEKREFLADVSSFANAGGGDLLYGISEVDGVPQDAIGLDCNTDSEILRLESIIRDGLDPRIPGVRMVPIEGFPQGPVLLIRIPKSWAAPHMIIFKKLSRFFTRNSAGKYRMDVSEIRSAFLLSEALPERMKRFRDERLGRIIAEETPVPLYKGAKLVLHILPVASFASDFTLDISTFRENIGGLYPMGAGGCNYRFNLDGFVTHTGSPSDTGSRAYCQIFRAGQMESVDADLVNEQDGKRLIASVAYEQDIIQSVHQYLGVLKKLEVPSPLLVLIGMLGVSGAYLAVNTFYLSTDPAPIDRDTLILPDILIEDYALLSDVEEVARLLRPAFDAVWNACGYVRSYNFDEQGNWKPK